MRINLGDDEQPEIGLIALIDCIFFLLMFFMVATSFKKADEQKKIKELPISLPAAAASLERSDAIEPPLVIGIDKEGNFYFGGVQKTTQQLHDALKREAEKDNKRLVRVEGDRNTRYNNIVHVLDLCELEGFTNIAMRTRN
ncbi:MAG TPA: biopolymer transporter ExbD [Cellvibrio sp.]